MTAKDAYIKAGYTGKNARQNAYFLLQNTTIHQLIEEKKAEISKSVDDQLALVEEEALEGILFIGRTGENDFAKLKAWQDILDRRRGKPAQSVNLGNQNDEPLVIKHIYPKEEDNE